MNERPPSPRPEVSNYMQGKIERVACNKAIYVQDLDRWDAMRAYAEAHGMSMSEFVFAAAAVFMDNTCPRCERIANILSTGSVKVTVAKDKPEAIAEPAKAKAKAKR